MKKRRTQRLSDSFCKIELLLGNIVVGIVKSYYIEKDGYGNRTKDHSVFFCSPALT